MKTPITNPKIHTAYSEKFKTAIAFTKPSLTKQAFKDECNINKIMSRYQKTGVLEFANQHQPQYGDVTSHDFQEAMQTVAKGKTMFADLPSHLRARFDNDPAQFLDFIHNPQSEQEMREIGLLRAVQAVKPPDPPPTPSDQDKSPPASS